MSKSIIFYWFWRWIEEFLKSTKTQKITIKKSLVMTPVPCDRDNLYILYGEMMNSSSVSGCTQSISETQLVEVWQKTRKSLGNFPKNLRGSYFLSSRPLTIVFWEIELTFLSLVGAGSIIKKKKWENNSVKKTSKFKYIWKDEDKLVFFIFIEWDLVHLTSKSAISYVWNHE